MTKLSRTEQMLRWEQTRYRSSNELWHILYTIHTVMLFINALNKDPTRMRVLATVQHDFGQEQATSDANTTNIPATDILTPDH